MDAEDTLWAIFIAVIVSTLITLLVFAFFVEGPEHKRKTALCEQAGGIVVADDGRYRLCLNPNAVIKFEDPANAN